MVNGCAITVIGNELEYKPSFRNSIIGVFQSIQYEVLGIIDFLGYSKEDYVINPYPLTIERVDGGQVPDILLGCIRSRLGVL